ncbi:PleD family two-component system response regulator [Patescibacteria group bacterium]
MKNNEKKKKILLIEDDPFLSRMYVKKFIDVGCEIITAFDGRKGLALAKKEHPDLVLLDLILPEIDGYEVLNELKKNMATASINVVILSNFFQKKDIERCLKAGAKDYLIKTHCMPSEVVEKVMSILFPIKQ